MCGDRATVTHMASVASRELRNHTADVLRRVSEGTRVTVTVNGTPVAEIAPVRATRSQYLTRSDLVDIVSRRQADAGLTGDLDVLAGATTDDLDAP